jgi:hypothetical protein
MKTIYGLHFEPSQLRLPGRSRLFETRRFRLGICHQLSVGNRVVDGAGNPRCEPTRELVSKELLPAFVVNLAAQIRPELFCDIRHRIPPDLCTPDARSGCQRLTLPRVIAVSGYCGRNRTADDLRKIELTIPGIAAGENNPAYRVTCPAPGPSLSHLVKAWILVEQGRSNGARKVTLDRAVGKC